MLKNEPVLWIAFLTAIIDLTIVFGVDINDAQKAAILLVVQTGAALLARSKVSPA